MTVRYPFHEVIAEELTEVFEDLIKKSIGELPLSFTLSNRNGCRYYLITNEYQKLLAILYFDYEKPGFEDRLEEFWRVLEKLRSNNNDQINACVFAIGLWGLTKFRDFRKNKANFRISSYDHIIETFKWYDFELDENLTMDIDSYIRYQNLPKDEKIEIADVLLETDQQSIDLAIRNPH